MFGAYVGFQFVMTLYLQTLNGWSAIETALAFLPAGLLVALVSTRIGPIVDRLGTPRLVALGALSLRRRATWRSRCAASTSRPSYVLELLPTMLLLGIGFALQLPDAEHRRAPTASATTSRGSRRGSCRPRSRSAARSGWRSSARSSPRQRRRLDRHRRDPRRLPDGARRRHRRRGRRAGDRAVGAAPAARGRRGHGRLAPSSCMLTSARRLWRRAGSVCGWPYPEDAGWPRRRSGRQTGSCTHAHTEGH